ncbi:MAG: hypothetical protein Q7R35_00490 [Elusimicrobiota bacterium]|nr:hypothetical protein [Elusimicrobiota bacterium]
MRKFLAFGLIFSLVSASTPAITHAVVHSVVSALEHSHDGGTCGHLHKGDSHHNAQLALLPPALSRRNSADAPGTDSVIVFLSWVSPSDGDSLVAPTSSPADAFVKLFLSDFIPQLASMPPPSRVSCLSCLPGKLKNCRR